MTQNTHRSAALAGAIALSAVAAPALAAADLIIATWNIEGGEQKPAALRDRAARMTAQLGTIDILALQEVVSPEQVAAIADGLGLGNWAISDFSPPVAIAGRLWGLYRRQAWPPASEDGEATKSGQEQGQARRKRDCREWFADVEAGLEAEP